MHSTEVQTKREKLLDNTARCLNPVFLLEQPKITRMGETSRKNFSVVLRRGRTCSKMRGTVLRTGKQKDGEQLYKFSLPCLDDHQIKKGRVGKQR